MLIESHSNEQAGAGKISRSRARQARLLRGHSYRCSKKRHADVRSLVVELELESETLLHLCGAARAR